MQAHICVCVGLGYLISTKCSGPPEVFTGFRAFTYAAGPCPAEYAMSSPPNSPPPTLLYAFASSFINRVTY